MERAQRVAFYLLATATFLGCEPERPLSQDFEPTSLTIAAPVDFVARGVQPFGTFRGVAYLRYIGRFEGTTELGDFRVPYEIITPADPARGNGTVLVEPPHFAFGQVGRDSILGRELLFENGFSYAAVGFGANGLNILDPAATDAIIAGEPVEDPGSIRFGLPPDEEIIIQFASALRTVPFAVEALGSVERVYAYGASQSAGALLETLHSPGGQGLFDLTLLHIAMWRPPFAAGEFQRLDGEFEPLSGVGRVVFVGSEGDQVVSDAEQFRRAAHLPDYRVYEVAGAAHLPTPPNPLDHFAVMRAIFVTANHWVRGGVEPPPSTLLEEAPSGEVDPVYGFATGIGRDGDLNARGGVRLPDLEVGRARYVAVDLSVPGLPITGKSIDLACVAPADASGDEPRFGNHGEYVSEFARQVNRLQSKRFLLPEDARILKEAAADSGIGKPGSCDA